MFRRMGYVYIAVVVTLVTLTSGCLLGGLKNIVSLELVPDKNVVFSGEEVVLTAIGKTAKGESISVKPKWEILNGSGSLEATKTGGVFSASTWDYNGEVTITGEYNKVTAQIKITVEDLPQTPADPFPQPTSAFDLPPNKTESNIVKIGDPVEYFSNWVTLKFKNGSTMRGWGRFVWDGVIMPPDDPDPATWVNERYYGNIPEIPRLSHRVHFERIDHEVLDRGTNYSRSVAHRTGTTREQATELAKRLTSETKASASWGWGQIETTLTAEITSRTQQSLKIEEEKTVTKTWSFQHPNDYDVYLYSSWNRVDTFYLSDSNGVPLDESPIFEGWGFSSQPVEIRGTGIVQRAWGFDY